MGLPEEQQPNLMGKAYEIVGQQFDVGSPEQFSTAMNDPGMRQKAFDVISQEYDLGSIDEFSSRLGFETTPQKPEHIGSGWLGGFSDVASGMHKATSGFFNMLDQWTNWAVEKTGRPKVEMFKWASEETDKWAKWFDRRGMDPDAGSFVAVGKMVNKGIGSASVDLPVIMASGLPVYSAAMAGAQAIEAGGSDIDIAKGTGVGLAHGLLLHGVFKGIGSFPLPERLGGGAVVFGGMSLQEELQKPKGQRDYQKVVADFIVGAGLAAPGKGQTRKELLQTFQETYGVDVPRATKAIQATVEKRPANDPIWKELKPQIKGRSEKTSPDLVSEKEANMRKHVQEIDANRERRAQVVEKSAFAEPGKESKITLKTEELPQIAAQMEAELGGSTFERSGNRTISTAPEWFRRLQPTGTGKQRLAQGITNKNSVLAVLKNVRDGKELTTKQSELWDVLKDEYSLELGKARASERAEQPKVTGTIDRLVKDLDIAEKDVISSENDMRRIQQIDVPIKIVEQVEVKHGELVRRRDAVKNRLIEEQNKQRGEQEKVVSPHEKYVDDFGQDPFYKSTDAKMVDTVDAKTATEATRRAEAMDPARVDGLPNQPELGYTKKKRFLHGQVEEPVVGRKHIRQHLDTVVPIRKGARGGGRQKDVLGQYSTKDVEILEKRWGDTATETHEYGHHIDKLLNITEQLGSQSSSVRAQLKKLDYDPSKKRASEGLAELVKYDLYLDSAKDIAPDAYKHLKLQLAKNPELERHYNQTKELIREYWFENSQKRFGSNFDMINERVKTGTIDKIKNGADWLIGRGYDVNRRVGDVINRELRTQGFIEKRKGEPTDKHAIRVIDKFTGKEEVLVPENFYRLDANIPDKYIKTMETNRGEAKIIDPDKYVAILGVIDNKGAFHGKKIQGMQNPFDTMTMLKQTARAKAHSMVFDGTRDVYGNVKSKSMKEVLKPISVEEMHNFIDYASARRVLTLATRDIHMGPRLSDAKAVFDKYDNRVWRKASDELSDWADWSLRYLKDAGGLSEKGYNTIKELNPFYLAMKRHFPDDTGGGAGKGVMGVGQPIKALRGGGEPIINPLEGMVNEVYRVILSADKIRIARSIADLRELGNMGRLLTKRDTPMEAKQVDISKIKKQLEEAGVVLDGADMDAALTIFTPGWEYKGNNRTVSFWRDGKREFYELSKPLHEALQGLEQKRLHPAIDFFLGKPARLIRLGATGVNMSFGLVTNPFRDLIASAIYGEGAAAKAPYRQWRGMADYIRKQPESRTFIEIGGEMASQMGLDRALTMKNIDKLMVEKGPLKGKAVYAAKHPIDALRQIIEVPEMGTRVGAFRESLKRGESKYGEGNPNAVVHAFNAARDVTVNFSKNGTYGAIINQIIPFWNASVQSGGKLVTFAKDNPRKFTMRGVSMITMPTIALWYINKDKDWYQSLPAQYKYNNWFFEVGDGHIVRLPKPFELGTLFGGFFEAALDQAYDYDDKAIEEALKLMFTNLYPGDVKDIALLRPWYDVWRNEDWLGRDIETESMQRLEKPERYRTYTSEFAKIYTKTMDEFLPDGWILSPVQFDHIMNGYTGGMWRSTSAMTRLATKGDLQLSDIPVAGRIFMREGKGPQREVNYIYEKAHRIDLARNTYRKKRKERDAKEAAAILSRTPQLRRWKEISAVRSTVTELLKRRRLHPERATEIDARIRKQHERMQVLMDM